METGGEGLYGAFRNLLKLTILGRDFAVPEGNTLLRCYQFLSPDAVAMGSFCWNGHCRNCLATLRRDGSARVCLSCQTAVEEGDSLEEISPEVRRALREPLEE